MESVILIAPNGYNPDFKAKVPPVLNVSESSEGRIVVDNGVSRIYIYRNDFVRNELERNRLESVVSKILDPIFYIVDFSDIRFCTALLRDIADDQELLVDNDHGLLVTGAEFIRILRSRPDWDWRRENR